MNDLPPLLPLKPTKFMDQFRYLIRAKQLAYSTEKTYCVWVKDFIRYHNYQKPIHMGSEEVDRYLSHLAVNRHVSINTQKTALNAIVFLYHKFLKKDLGTLNFTPTSRPRTLPTVFSHDEAKAVLNQLTGIHKLAASLMYGAGLRVKETTRLRIQDIDFSNNCIVVREAKGLK